MTAVSGTVPATAWMAMFRKFIQQLQIDSKEDGVARLRLYGSQEYFLQELAEGLENDIHSFTILKARQLGLSTIMLAVDIFWLFLYPGLQGALVTDTDGNREQFRKIIIRYMKSLPLDYRIRPSQHNREHLVLSNGSSLRYLVAGTTKKGALGVGAGFNFVHATECSRYGDPEAMASFIASLAENNPNRLYVFESTARGFNMFLDMWTEAKEAPDQKAIFIGWWTKETYRLKRGSRLYNHHFDGTYTPEEAALIEEVKAEYAFDVDDEQVAWYRYTTKRLNSEGGYVAQEHPWTEKQAFMLSGKNFFPAGFLTKAMQRAARNPNNPVRQPGVQYYAYRYHLTDRFMDTKIEEAFTTQTAELKVWEEPDPDGIYAIGADPAYGDSVDDNAWRDKFSIQVFRCYADRLVQVAEYASDDLAPHQFAWILAHLGGWYGNVRVCLEINGPGIAVDMALKQLKTELENGDAAKRARDKGLDKIFDNWAWYLYHRPDSLAGNYMKHFQSTSTLKSQIMARLKDCLMTNFLVINSVELIKEMQTIITKDGWVGGEGRAKDDRTLAAALANRAYDDFIRSSMVKENRTFENEQKAREARTAARKPATLISYIVKDHFETAERQRINAPSDGSWPW